MRKVLLIDDDARFLDLLGAYLRERHPGMTIMTCSDPVRCLGQISRDLDLMVVDLEMPRIDGAKVLAYATDRGLDKNRIIILSAHDAAYLHQRFPLGSCLAVLNKHEMRQKEVLDMVFSQLEVSEGRQRGRQAAEHGGEG